MDFGNQAAQACIVWGWVAPTTAPRLLQPRVPIKAASAANALSFPANISDHVCPDCQRRILQFG